MIGTGGSSLRPFLLALVLVTLVPLASAWPFVVVFDATVGPGAHTLEFAPSEHFSHGHLEIECSAATAYGWQQSNVTEDELVWPCLFNGGHDVPAMGMGAGYQIDIVTSGGARVRVLGEPGWWHSPHDERPYAFLWNLEGPDFHAHATTGHFRAARDMTDVVFRTETGIQAELVQIEPDVRYLGSATRAGTPVADLEEGHLYVVEMTILATCQPECWARSEVAVQGTPVG